MSIDYHRDGPWDLPEGWVWTSLATITSELVAGKRPQGGATADGSGCLSIGGEHLKPDGTFDFSVPRFIPADFAARLEHARLRPGDICIVKDGATTGKTCFFSSDRVCFVNEHVFVLRVSPATDPKFAYYWLWSLSGQNEIQKDHRGSAQGGIGRTVIDQVQVPIAPVREQHRIVARIDELFTEIGDGEAALERARHDIDAWRRALLKAAVSGELTRQWREEVRLNETGEEFARRIASQCRGSRVRTSRRGRGEPFSGASITEIPSGWTIKNLGELICDGPANGYSPKASKDAIGSLALKLTATTSGTLDLSSRSIKRLSETVKRGSNLFLTSGDLLFQRGNTREYVGISAIYEGPPDTYVYPDLMIRVRTPDELLTKWVWRCANSVFGRKFMQDNAGGSAGTMPKITGEIVCALPIPLPPRAEMHQALIVLDEALSATTDVEAEIGATSVTDAQRQSILKAAFEGRLVPQDPRDETAQHLLVRLGGQDEANQSRHHRQKRRRVAEATE